MTSGILLLDKPLGLSSNAALQRVRRALGVDKAGHVGSLDPLATGMLPICLGEATKVAGDIVAGRKRYRFVIGLGVRTATGDSEGAVVETAPVPPLDRETIEAGLRGFTGLQKQVPPMYSALKKDGQPLYKLARAGIEVERAAREIEITAIELGCFDATSLEIEVSCSKGTYVRSLAEDIARALGTCGHVTSLRRLYVEPFEGQPMETLASVETVRQGGPAPRVIAADAALGHLPSVTLDAAAAARLMLGQSVAAHGVGAAARLRLYETGGRFLGLGEADAFGLVRPRRLFVGREPGR